MSLAVVLWEDLRRQCSVITGLATPPCYSLSVEWFFFGLGRANCNLWKCQITRRREKTNAFSVLRNIYGFTPGLVTDQSGILQFSHSHSSC